MFQCALSYGMTSEEFWFGHPQHYFVYQDAFADKEKKRHDEIDVIAWIFGRYDMKAFAQVYANSWSKKKQNIYPEQPESIKGRIEKTSLSAKDRFEQFKLIADSINRHYKETH